MFITPTAIAAFVAASLSAGVTLYAYFAGKKDGYRKGLEEGFDKGFTKASSFTPPPPAFDKNTCMFDMLGILAIASALSDLGSKKNTADHMPDTPADNR